MTALTAEKIAKILSDVPEQNQFRLYMGTSIKNLHELADAIEIMADRTFLHHVSEGRNDFSNWIKDVLGDHELSEKLKKQSTKQGMVGEIKRRVAFLERKPSEHVMCRHNYMECGVNDFAVGTLIGFIIGVIIAAIL